MDPGNDPNIPLKRKRGRPRKDPTLEPGEKTRPKKGQTSNSLALVPVNMESAENAPLPPGFEGVNASHSHQDASGISVGQVVVGVVESVFNGGCSLCVRVGNSDTFLRGPIFMPGHNVPVSFENDVVPNVQMISRNELSFPAVNYMQMQSHNTPAREKNKQHVASRSNGFAQPAQGLSSGSKTPVVTPHAANPAIDRKALAVANVASKSRNVVPVESQPALVPDGGWSAYQPIPVTSQAAQANIKGKYVKPAASSLNETAATHQPTVGGRMIHPPPKKEIYKTVAVKESVNHHGSESNNDDYALVDVPLRVEPAQHSFPASVLNFKPLDHKTCKMTELLRALQENIPGNAEPQGQEPAGTKQATNKESTDN